jgi:L-lysine exporter family protein LysE/ArgO
VLGLAACISRADACIFRLMGVAGPKAAAHNARLACFPPVPPPPMNSMAPALLQGWLMMAGLIVAIGAQNALVLRQGLLRRHVGLVVALCTLSDWLLTALGVFGLGGLLAAAPGVMQAMRWLGAAWLCWYAALAARRAWRAQGELAGAPAAPLSGVIGNTLAVTWLNPHVYLDTVVLMGTAASGLARPAQLGFALGAGLASAMWFSLLGHGAARLAPRLARPEAWRWIDAVIALVMLVCAWQLLRSG